ncbi:hypothetical protein BH10PSE12_BH10PSE12_24290 [soil metagenome]
MPSSVTSISRWFGVLSLALALAACGKSGTTTGNGVAMKDLEVVDGTTTDAMTDLDGVRAEGTAMAPQQPGNASAGTSSSASTAAPPPAANSADAKSGGAEVVSDQ